MRIKSVWIGLKNLWRWKGVVWRDRDWDYWFLLRMLQFKLGNMEEYFERAAIVDATETVDEIRRAMSAVDFILAEGPSEIAWSGWEPYKNLSWVEFEKSLSEPLPDEWYERREEEERLMKEALGTAFDTMRDKLQGWWD